MSFPGVPLEDPILEAERQRLIVRTRQWRGVYFQPRAAPPPSALYLEDEDDAGRRSILPAPIHPSNALPCPLGEDCSSPSSQGATLSCDADGRGALGKRCQCVAALLRVAMAPGGIYVPSPTEATLPADGDRNVSSSEVAAVGGSESTEVAPTEVLGSQRRRVRKRRRPEAVASNVVFDVERGMRAQGR